MPLATRAVLAREAISKIASSSLEPLDMLHEVVERVRAVMPYEGAGAVVLDHDALVPTARSSIGLQPLLSDLLRNEVTVPDVHKFVEISRCTRPVVAMSGADRERIETSTRRQTILTPSGVADEVRMVFRAHGSTWGGACFLRDSTTCSFTDEELRFLADVADEVGQGLRRSLVRRPVDAITFDPGPGVLLVDEQLNVVSATSAARHWRGLMSPEANVAVHSVVLRAQTRPSDEGARRVRVRLTTGDWLVLDAGPLDRPDTAGGAAGDGPGLTAVTLKLAQRSESVSLMLRLHGLSARERDVTELLLQGLSTEDTAARLHISRHTLRDHLKSIFGKVGVGSRPELMAVLSGGAPVELRNAVSPSDRPVTIEEHRIEVRHERGEHEVQGSDRGADRPVSRVRRPARA